MSGNIHTLGGGRSLRDNDANPEPLPEAWANRASQPRIGRIGGPSTSTPPRGSGRFASLQDLANSEPPRPAPGSRHSDDEDDEAQPQNFFAGGERSGLSVQNPNHSNRRENAAQGQVRDILRRAAEGSRAASSREAARSGAFAGQGFTLGSDEVESQVVPDPNAEENEADTAVRSIVFWRTGFTIENGPLLLYTDPDSAKLLESIQQGLAPPEALNVRVGQPVELRVSKRLDEDYVPPPPGPFAGTGNRLGSPVPGTTSSTSTAAPPTSAPVQTAVSGAGSFEVDMSAPTTSVQIRLADGTRLVSRMNLTHTVGDIRRFINAARPGSSSRPYVIQTTLPVRTLDDESLTIEAANLKNSVVVQRWL